VATRNQGENPRLLNAPHPRPSEPNLTAAAGCRYALAQLLVQHGADVNAKSKEGKTPADLLSYPGKQRAFRRLFSGARR
jgi:ankyrin repeat protein